MSVLLTLNGFNKLKSEMERLIAEERPEACQMVTDTRPIGVPEDNPEFIQALEYQETIERRISDLTYLLANSQIFEKHMIRENTVSFGSTVEYVDLDTDITRKYTIVSIYESDIPNNLISIESPFVQNILGMHTGDYFDFNDKDYQITNISYHF